MLRPFAAARLAASLLLATLACSGLAIADGESPGSSLARAEALLGRGEAVQAVPILEDALIVSEASARPKVVAALRLAYAKAVAQAEAAGQTREAENFRANLAILERQTGPEPGTTPQPKPEAEAPSPLPALEEGEHVAPPATESPATRDPGRLDLPDADAEAKTLPSPPPAEPAPKTEPDPAREALARADKAFRARQYLDAGAIFADLARQKRLPDGYRDAWAYCRRFAVVQRINAGPRNAETWAAIAAELAQIRRLTPDHWYDEYLANLVRERAAGAPRGDGRKVVLRGAAPEERTPAQAPALARAPVTPRVEPISAPARPGPSPAPADTAPEAEIPPALGEPAPMVDPFAAALDPVDGPAAAPEVPSQAPRPSSSVAEPSVSTADEPAGQPAPAAPNAPAVGQPVPFTSPDLSNWQIYNSDNFRIYHADPALARRVAEIAEAARDAQTRRWTGDEPKGRWAPVCEVYLYPNAQIYSERTGQPEDSPGFSTFGLMAGRVTARRLNLHADHPKLLDAVLPHEVTHIILAEMFPVRQIPRWADEGMAVLAEPAEEQALRDADLDHPVHGGQVFSVEQIITLEDYPDSHHWPLYYAQSISLTRFLVEQSSPTRFAQFVRDTQEIGPEPALRKHYKIQGFADLQTQWLAYARKGRDGEVRTAAAPSDTARD